MRLGVQFATLRLIILCLAIGVQVYLLVRTRQVIRSSHRSQRFKSVTSMSPLQYQKVLRLQEARRLMLSPMMDAGTASRNVGYMSASQFSREYGRFFGNAPTKDITRLREQVGAAALE